ncbi:MAG: hypothetical protein LBO00_01750 [Zoogloeaceae bacterium]|jgi:hypothetical protein|nr:hypothetical protein [Zoogloeaceae bacterium]
MTKRNWTSEEERALLALVDLGLKASEIGAALKRSPESIHARLRLLRPPAARPTTIAFRCRKRRPAQQSGAAIAPPRHSSARSAAEHPCAEPACGLPRAFGPRNDEMLACGPKNDECLPPTPKPNPLPKPKPNPTPKPKPNPLPRTPVQERKCITCGRLFQSAHSMNRMCPECRRRVANSGLPAAFLDFD